MSGCSGPIRPVVAAAPFVIAVAVSACGCGGGTNAVAPSGAGTTPGRGGTLVVGSTVDADAWNEYVSQQTLAINLLRRIYARLAQEQGDSSQHPPSYEPLLASSWSYSPDGLTLSFKLRDATWSDGKPLTAGDVREDQPYTFLYEGKRIAILGPRVRDLTIDVPSDPLARIESCWLAH